jgi:putative transcriptional regulator
MENYFEKYLEKNQISITELAKRTGISQSLLSMIKNGQRYPSFSIADRIAHYFDVPVEDIFPRYQRRSPYPDNTVSSCK